MKTVIIKEDVRFLGVSYSPGEKPVELEDDVADNLVKIGCAEPAKDAEAGAVQAEAGKKPEETFKAEATKAPEGRE